MTARLQPGEKIERQSTTRSGRPELGVVLSVADEPVAGGWVALVRWWAPGRGFVWEPVWQSDMVPWAAEMVHGNGTATVVQMPAKMRRRERR